MYMKFYSKFMLIDNYIFLFFHRSPQFAVVHDEIYGMERGPRGVMYGQAKFYPVCSNGATWVWRCDAKAPRTHQRCKVMLYTTPP